MTTTTECCPRFDPSIWDNKSFEWNDKRFIKGKVRTFFYMPLGFGKVMQKLQAKIEESGGEILDYLTLSDHSSKSNMDLYLAVDKEIEGVENVLLTGKYYSKVYEGNFKDTGLWMEDFDEQIKENAMCAEKMYMWYTTCPKCAKKYGKNYAVVIAKIG